MKYGTSYKHHNLKGYLLTIARNICFNYFRDKKEKVTAIEWTEIDKIPNNKDMLTQAEDAVYLRNLLKDQPYVSLCYIAGYEGSYYSAYL